MTLTAAIWFVALVLLAVVWWRKPGGLTEVWRFTRKQGIPVSFRVVLGIMTAGFVSLLLPRDTIALVIGPGSGLTGVAFATVAGYLIPGGAGIAFPVLAALLHAGAGEMQIAAMLCAWSIFTVNRFFVWEVPTMGFAFARRRLAVSVLVPVLAGAAVGFVGRFV